jgi:hypothetical protein
VVAVKIAMDVEVIEAALRLLDPKINAYPGLVLAGSEESAKKFHADVTKVAEFVGEVATAWGMHDGDEQQ